MSSDAPAAAPPAVKSVPSQQSAFNSPPPPAVTSFWEKFLKSKEFNSLMGILTIYALVGDDIRLAFYEMPDDQFFFNISIVALFLFILELGLNVIFRPEYLWGFYFWLDLISTASMLPDTNLLNELTVGGDSTATLKAGKTSRAGAKAGRVVKIVRLIRFVRIFKLLKLRKENLDQQDQVGKDKQSLDEQLDEEPSKVGKKLTELTVRKVIIIVLVMIMLFPFLDDPQAFLGETDLNSYQLNKIVDLHLYTDTLNGTESSFYPIDTYFFKKQVQQYALDQYEDLALIYLKFSGWDVNVTNGWIREVDVNHRHHLYHDPEDVVKDFRLADAKVPDLDRMARCEFDTRDGLECGTRVFFDLKENNKFSSVMSLAKTFVIVIGLSISVIVFSRDAENLVISPIERMIKLVKKLAENPLASLYDEGEKKEENADAYETNLLESTLEKISSLLQVGFGIAGAEIIQSNMSSGGDLNVMIPGKKITAVFGFGIMDEFTNTCSCLEEQMCTYINTIAKIIHENSILFHGAPNKNIGSAFLLVWKICEGVLPGLRDLRDADGIEMDDETKLSLRANIGYQKKGVGNVDRLVRSEEMVDSAMISLMKMRIDLHNANQPNGVLDEFKKNPKLVDYYEGKFDVEMGFGMHIGWAIEGAIGSTYKIDASYLSPNVNMAARLEAATHQFGTPILLSGSLINEMSIPARGLCRKIDVVTVKGSVVPIELWTADISNNEPLPVTPVIVDGCQQIIDISLVAKVQRDFRTDFKAEFKTAVDAYIGGDWKFAKSQVIKCLEIYPDDGPSNSLMKVMGWSNFEAPKGWRGYRELTSK